MKVSRHMQGVVLGMLISHYDSDFVELFFERRTERERERMRVHQQKKSNRPERKLLSLGVVQFFEQGVCVFLLFTFMLSRFLS